jgi:glucose/arabinose dehydrogenase
MPPRLEPRSVRRWILLFIAGSAALLSCGSDDSQSPPPAGAQEFIEPVWEYDHSQGNSITGGYVYRGTALTDLIGRYVYGDFVSGRIWALDYGGTNPSANEELVNTTHLISTFGLADDGTLLFMPYGRNQRIQRINGSIDRATSEWTYTVGDAYRHPFDNAVDLQNSGDGRIFVVEQAGRILVFDPTNPTAPTTFLDLRSVVTSGGELGLLGLAFPPDYAARGQFFVYYTVASGPWEVRVCRFELSGDPNVADPSSEVLLIAIPQEFPNHNGGALAFDGNGHLLVGVGDEGGGGDPNDNGQNRADLHGTILRLDINRDTPPYYQIPSDNPFASSAVPEVYAYGLRNPWRISYDASADQIWVADVGQNRWEEVDLIVAGGNYGWDCREGAHPYVGPPDGPAPTCTRADP